MVTMHTSDFTPRPNGGGGIKSGVVWHVGDLQSRCLGMPTPMETIPIPTRVDAPQIRK